jgi:hypothetical protein
MNRRIDLSCFQIFESTIVIGFCLTGIQAQRSAVIRNCLLTHLAAAEHLSAINVCSGVCRIVPDSGIVVG